MFKFGETKRITETLYAQNLELAVKNKTLSLLEKLYQTSTRALMPEEMAKAITDIICKDLNLEFAGVLVFKKESDSLDPLAFSKSERLLKILSSLGLLFEDTPIKNVSGRDFFVKVIHNQAFNIANDLQEVYGDLIKPEHLKEITTHSHIKTALIFPLATENQAFGALLLGFNRDYETLNTFEKASIQSF